MSARCSSRTGSSPPSLPAAGSFGADARRLDDGWPQLSMDPRPSSSLRTTTACARRWRYRVCAAADDLDGLDVARRERPDLILVAVHHGEGVAAPVILISEDDPDTS